MNLTPIWGSLTVLFICPLLGGLPLIDWITYTITGRQLSKLGTGNVSVSAAFYHGGKLAGIFAVLSEAAKGILAVLMTRLFFPAGSVWEIIAIIALVMGRYWLGKSAGTTNAVWGITAHDPIAAGLVWLISLVSFTIVRDRLFGKYSALVLLTVIIALRNPHQPEYGFATLGLASILAWIYSQIPDDLDLKSDQAVASSSKMFRFFQGDKNIITLDTKLNPRQVGSKAANLALLKQKGYAVAEGWILPPGNDPTNLVEHLNPTSEKPLIVRSSAIGEDSETASAAGQYLSILNITNREQLQSAIIDCQDSYLQANAIDYRRHQAETEASMALLIQQQIEGLYSGVAFSRDPVDRLNDTVAVEALPGKATKIVSGRFTPQRYRVAIPETNPEAELDRSITVNQENTTEHEATIPLEIIESVAILAREMEDLFDGIPQDLEWTYDGDKIWLLQVRPITTLQPIWTRKIAAEVIPGKIRPLTWSINQPLTCGVWGKLFTVVLGGSARDLDFNQTATLHFGSAYFNVTLLGTIFRRMGLPPESLEFLTRGAKFTKPPLMSTIKNIPGLWRLFNREIRLGREFTSDRDRLFIPIIRGIQRQDVAELSATEIVDRINTILSLLDKVTYYNILAPLSLAIRQGIFRVTDAELDYSQTPELAAVNSLAEVAADTRKLLATEQITLDSCASLFAHIAENPEGTSIMKQFDLWLDRYGYLSEVATDIAVPRWRDKPAIPRQMFARFFFDAHGSNKIKTAALNSPQSIKAKIVQKRLNLKGAVAEIYNQLLANLRWSFLALAKQWLATGLIQDEAEIFLLKLEEVVAIAEGKGDTLPMPLSPLIEQRQQQWSNEQALTPVPSLVYGQPDSSGWTKNTLILDSQTKFRGIGASGGQIEGVVKILSNLQNSSAIDNNTIIVVPYTDAGWSPILARAGGLVSEVGGRLSHGAIVAREYNIPAVMDVAHATEVFRDGQRIRINGHTGIVELLN